MSSTISRGKLIKKLKSLGFSGPFSGRKHQFMSKGNLKIRIPNPHQSRDIDIHLLKEILRQANISHQDWDDA
ncbi:MAG TPA: type II toxin-antitoxin system HicA family toxin [Spirochaetes bacterium]|nr:type II toxin-antitoxin system HicA family toxin [Spirochaetota bacterium]